MTTFAPIALQLWTIRHAIAENAADALGQVRAAGFSAVEVAPLPPELPADQFGDCLDRHGLSVVSIHGDLPNSSTIESWTNLARVCRSSRIIWHGWPRDPRLDSLAGVREVIAECNHAGALARDHGLSFGIHNHWWEFDPVDGTSLIRLFHEMLDPEIFWQLDVYWAQTAGADPARIIRELGPRIRSIHWKDGPAVHGQPMTALGEGKVDIPRMISAISHPVDSIIELDECATDPLDAARRGRIYLEAVH